MGSIRRITPAVAAALLAVSTASCTITTTTGPSQPDNAVFLDALSGPIRSKYPESVLIAEGQKACDAFAQGQNEDQVKKMIEKDLQVNAGQFIGAVYGGMACFPKDHPNHGGN